MRDIITENSYLVGTGFADTASVGYALRDINATDTSYRMHPSVKAPIIDVPIVKMQDRKPEESRRIPITPRLWLGLSSISAILTSPKALGCLYSDPGDHSPFAGKHLRGEDVILLLKHRQGFQ